MHDDMTKMKMVLCKNVLVMVSNIVDYTQRKWELSK